MAIVFNSDAGTISGLSVGGLPDGIVDGDMLAANAITAGKIVDGTIVNADINSSAAIAGSKISGSFGKVLQVLQDSGSSTWSSSSSYVDTGATVNITPSSTSSKIALFANCPHEHHKNNGTDTGMRFGIYRGSTQLREVTNYRQFYMTTTGVSTHGEMSINYLDSPSSTSELTYKIQFRNYYANNAHSVGASLIVMEIAG
jgi:hypothetical protein